MHFKQWFVWSDHAGEVLWLKVLEHTVHHSLLYMGQRSRRPGRVPVVTTPESGYNEHVNVSTGV